jgi:hypothetical protein
MSGSSTGFTGTSFESGRLARDGDLDVYLRTIKQAIVALSSADLILVDG